MIIVEPGDEHEGDDVVEGEQTELATEFADLALNAISGQGAHDNGSMRLKGYHKRRGLNILVDTGSSLNFIDERLIKGLNCTMVAIAPLKVTLADGTDLFSTKKIPRFEWMMQGYAFTIEVHVLPISSCDFILGVPWLVTLGTIHWNF